MLSFFMRCFGVGRLDSRLGSSRNTIINVIHGREPKNERGSEKTLTYGRRSPARAQHNNRQKENLTNINSTQPTACGKQLVIDSWIISRPNIFMVLLE